MKSSSFFQGAKLIAFLLLIACTGAAVLHLGQSEEWVFMAFAILLLLGEIVYIFRLYGKNARKLAFTFDSMDNNDFSFRFSTDGLSRSDRIVNESLNRIKQILQTASEDAREKEKYYEIIINSINAGIVVLDEAGNVLQKNDRALQLLGLSVFTHCSQLKRIGDEIHSRLSSIMPGERLQAQVQTEIGSSTLSLIASLASLNGKDVRVVVIDNIDNELSENEMESWIKLTRVLTHEIMNSITPVTSLSGTLLEKTDDSKAVKEGLEIINKTGRELISFVESYRKFTHIPTPKPTLFYVKDMAVRMREIAQRQEGIGDTRITLDICPEDLLVYADESLISNVMTNLLKNAVQAIADSGQGSEIIIKGYSDAKDCVVIDIIDDGPEIPEDVAAHIFVPFFTTKESGSGVGLSLSRQIMRVNGGSLNLVRSKDGRTTFRLKFE